MLFENNMSFWDIVLTIISLFVLVAWVLSIIFILWWGVLLILSGWKEDKIKPAINTIRYSILGLIITVVTIFLFPILGRLLNIDVEQYAKPSRIFERIEEIGSNIFWSNTTNYKTNDLKKIESDTISSDFEEL